MFNSKAVSLLEKRQLMKFLQFAAVYKDQEEKWKDVEDAPLVQLLERESMKG